MLPSGRMQVILELIKWLGQNHNMSLRSRHSYIFFALSILVILNQVYSIFLCKFTFSWIINRPWPYGTSIFRDEWLAEMFLKSAVSPKKIHSMFSNIIFEFLCESWLNYSACSLGGAVPQRRLDHDAACGDPLESARGRQGMVQYPRD